MDIYELLNSSKYYTTTDLRYNNEYKFFLSQEELESLKDEKDNAVEKGEAGFNRVDLLSFNSKHIYYVDSKELKNLIHEYQNSIVVMNENVGFDTINAKHFGDMLVSRVYSEIEGTLAVENVPTTRTRIEQLKKGAKPENKNDQIVLNMLRGIDFILNKPEFNKDNLHKLYTLLSEGCLEKDKRLKDYYRNDVVYIDKYEGCPKEKIENSMNCLFEFVKEALNDEKYSMVLPHICHYYLLYIHPYFDYNGRTARMVALWIELLANSEDTMPIYLSEAINDSKGAYYEALRESRNMSNDVTYFLIYIYKTAIKYAFTYKNLEYIEEQLMKNAITLSPLDKVYLKKIILKANQDYFDFKKYLIYVNIDESKQAALKTLNKFEKYGILESRINDKKVKLFRLIDCMIKYNQDW